MSLIHNIHVSSAAESLSWASLVPILERIMAVQFRFSRTNAPKAEQTTLIEEDLQETDSPGSSVANPSSLTVPHNASSTSEGDLRDTTILFADDPEVPFPFRGRSLRSKITADPVLLSLSSGEKALATNESGPVWSLKVQNGARCFRSGFTLPRLSQDKTFQTVLNGDRFFEILPLLHWLREICGDSNFEGPPLRACIVFDDPNLHWPHYGFVNFQEIAQRAEKENYHVSFATIPLDAWFTHKKSAEIFRNNTSRLSLAVHGNNHSKRELARSYEQAERMGLLRQAINRMERLERNSGLRVDRVMVPPHGACSEEMLASLPDSGFEAACISHGSLRAHNPLQPWTRDLGYRFAEQVNGCPVLPRWAFSGNSINTILLAAFLKQAIVLRGHHQDLKNGVELLDQHARFINGLGPVLWSNLAGLSQVNYQWRMSGSICHLEPLSRKATFHVPPKATHLHINPPSNTCWQAWHVCANDTKVVVRAGDSFPIKCQAQSISIEAVPQRTPNSYSEEKPPACLALLRRFLTEGRDRFLQ